MFRVLPALVVFALGAVGLPACLPPPKPPECKYTGNINIVAGAFGLGNTYRLAAYAAGQNWNDSGNEAPDFVWDPASAPNTVTVTETNDINKPKKAGWTDGSTCPFTNRNVVLNRYVIGDDIGTAVATAAHEFGHALGLGHDPFHVDEEGYRLKPEDCSFVSLMYWENDRYRVCGVNRPTAYDNDAINAHY